MHKWDHPLLPQRPDCSWPWMLPGDQHHHPQLLARHAHFSRVHGWGRQHTARLLQCVIWASYTSIASPVSSGHGVKGPSRWWCFCLRNNGLGVSDSLIVWKNKAKTLTWAIHKWKIMETWFTQKIILLCIKEKRVLKQPNKTSTVEEVMPLIRGGGGETRT